MTETCTYPTDRDETLVAYLYDDIDAAARTAFEAHLSSCTACRDELESLQGVRASARWLGGARAWRSRSRERRQQPTGGQSNEVECRQSTVDR